LRRWAEPLGELAAEGPDGQDAVRRILGYLMAVNDALTPETLEPLLEGLPAGPKESMMTLAEQFEARGEARGEIKGERKLLLRQLVRKFGELPYAVRQRVEEADEARLSLWAERILSAETLDDVLAE
jgi:hypothetical protein